MFENSKLIKKLHFNNLKKLKNQGQYERMIGFMDIDDRDELEYVFETIVPFMNTNLIYLFACRTDYRSDFINDLFIKLEYVKLNPLVKEKNKSEMIISAAEEIIKFVRNTKNPSVDELKKLIKLTGNTHYIYTFWLYACSNDDLELVDEVLKTKSLTYMNLLYHEFSNSETGYSLNVIAPKIINEEMAINNKNNENYDDIVKKINEDIIIKCNHLMLKYNISSSSEFNLIEEINRQSNDLDKIIREHKNRRITKREIVELIGENKLPLLGSLKYICTSQEQINRLIDKLCDNDLKQLIIENESLYSDYVFTDQMLDVIYSKTLNDKEKIKIK